MTLNSVLVSLNLTATQYLTRTIEMERKESYEWIKPILSYNMSNFVSNQCPVHNYPFMMMNAYGRKISLKNYLIQ